MAHAATSPLFGALESAVEEQVGRDAACPAGAGVLRPAGADACRDPQTGDARTGSGGEGWCTNCHAPAENLGRGTVPAWRATTPRSGTRAPVGEHLRGVAREGVGCLACHAAIGSAPAHGQARGAYEGNPTWTSARTGEVFLARPEDRRGVTGIANAGYLLQASSFFLPASQVGAAHARPDPGARAYAKTSEACGACHDVRLFGVDAERGEPFKRLRNAYSEWRAWADTEARVGRPPASCQDCHMSLYPGVCEPAPGAPADGGCPPGTRFAARPPGARGAGGASHWFSGVDLPMSDAYPDAYADARGTDADGVPMGARARRDLLLARTFRFAVEGASRAGASLEVPVVLENVGAGHRVPAGFSQEREIWVELVVRDGRGDVAYEVGRLDAPDADLADKVFLRVTTRDDVLDPRGRPLGVFGADVVDGRDAPRWSPDPARGGTRFRGLGLVNLQNGFLRCVRCVGVIDARGACQPGPGQGRTRADRFEDGAYELETGACRSNLSGRDALFETYFPVGALDAERGEVRAPDAIIDARSAPPGVPITYTYALDVGRRPGPFHVTARLRFRAFPPYLVRAFAEYEAGKDRAGLRADGPQVRTDMLRRVDVVDIGRAEATVP